METTAGTVRRLDQLEAQLTRERIACQTARDEAAHWRAVAERLGEQVKELRTAPERARRSNRDRQVKFRRQHQFAPPISEETA